jgi:hypothetical protein
VRALTHEQVAEVAAGFAGPGGQRSRFLMAETGGLPL